MSLQSWRAESAAAKIAIARPSFCLLMVWSGAKAVEKACIKPLFTVDSAHSTTHILCAFAPAAGQWSVNTCSMLCAQMHE